MNRSFTFLTALLLTATIWAQSPEKMSYQAVIRNASGELVTTQVGIKLSILKGDNATSAIEEYSETLTATPNANGLVSIEFGGETGWDAIDWSNGKFFIKTETDIDNDATYDIEGVSQLLSVPFAFYATEAGNIPDVSNLASQSALEDSVADVRANIPDVNGISTNKTAIFNNVQAIQDTAIQIRGNIPDVSGISTNTTAIFNNVQAIQDTAAKIRADINIESILKQLKELQLETGLAIKDIDGNIYKIVTIGTQTWMAENLRVTQYADGTPISLVTDNTAWAALGDNDTDKAYCLYDNNSLSNSQTYGALYTYAAATNGDNSGSNVQGACPTGWHLPSDVEWTELTDYIASDGHSGAEGAALKATSGWHSTGDNGTDDYSFTALPGGNRRDNNGMFDGAVYGGYWWGSTQTNSSYATRHQMGCYSAIVTTFSLGKSYGYSIRCVRD